LTETNSKVRSTNRVNVMLSAAILLLAVLMRPDISTLAPDLPGGDPPYRYWIDGLGIKALDDHTVQFRLTEPHTPFLRRLAQPQFSILPTVGPNERRRSGLNAARPGTGPYILNTVGSNTYRLERNPDYYGKQPHLQTLAFTPMDHAERLQNFKDGKIDHASLTPTTYRTARNDPELSKYLVEIPAATLIYLGFDCTQEPFNDPRMRRLAREIVSEEKIAELFFHGAVTPIESSIPLNFPGRPDWEPPELKKDKPFDYKGTELQLQIMDQGWQPMQQALTDWFTKAGFKVSVGQTPVTSSVPSDRADLFMMIWLSDWPDPDNFSYQLFSPPGNLDAPSNYGNYLNPEALSIAEKARFTPDGPERMELYRQFMDKLYADPPWAAAFQGKTIMLVQPWVDGLVISPSDAAGVNFLNSGPLSGCDFRDVGFGVGGGEPGAAPDGGLVIRATTDKPEERREYVIPTAPGYGSMSMQSVDPPRADIVRNGDTAIMIRLVYETLVRLDEEANPIPGLAESWEISPDGLAYTFHLRKDVRFHDGKPFTARDVEYSLSRVINPRFGSPHSRALWMIHGAPIQFSGIDVF